MTVPASPIVTFETTAGNLVFELSPEEAPLTVANFLHYVRAGFYAGTVFHRVIPRFVAQGGGYLADGTRKTPLRPPIKLEVSKKLRHESGALAMARLPEPDTATCEFYVADGPQKDLDGKYAVFGRLADGRDVVRRILEGPRRANDWPVNPVVILRAYEGKPDASHPAAAFALPPSPATPASAEAAEAVRAAARKLRGRAALLRAKRPLTSFADLEAAIAKADRSGLAGDLEAAERLLAEKERR